MAAIEGEWGLVIEYRLQNSETDVQVNQLVCFDNCVYGRDIDTASPRRHWKHYNIIPERGDKTLDERLDLTTAWIKASCQQFESAGFTLTREPFPVQVTRDEFETEILKGDFPRNVALRIDRVRRDEKRPNPLDPERTT